MILINIHYFFTCRYSIAIYIGLQVNKISYQIRTYWRYYLPLALTQARHDSFGFMFLFCVLEAMNISRVDTRNIYTLKKTRKSDENGRNVDKHQVFP